MNAADLMTKNPRTVRATDSIGVALDALQTMEVRHLPVVDDRDELVGMLSDRDLGPLMRTFTEAASDVTFPQAGRPVSELMSLDPVSVDLETELHEVVATMLGERIGAVAVVDADGGVVGIISYVDVLRVLGAELEPHDRRSRPRATRLRRTASEATGGEVEEEEPAGQRRHGDSYADIVTRGDDLVAESSSHGGDANRLPEEPSERVLGSPDRLEGDLEPSHVGPLPER